MLPPGGVPYCRPVIGELRSRAEALWRWPARRRFQRELEPQVWRAPDGEPVLSYGGAIPREPGAIVHGGRVKLLHLRERFPESAEFNILYLVSSAMPPHAADLVAWAKARGVKFVWNQNGVAFPAWAGNQARAINRPMAALLSEADHVIYQSVFCRESADRFLGLAPGPNSVLFNPVNLTEFVPAAMPPSVDCWQLLTAGTHHQSHRVTGPIRALSRLLDTGQEARLTVAGELRWRNSAAEVRATLDECRVVDRVTFRPAFMQAEAAAIYGAAHLLFHPKYHDPCPTVPIEAMACGVPVIASRSGGMPELVGDEGGALIDVLLSWNEASEPTPETMATAARELMQDWPARSLRARARAERLFDHRAWVDHHARIFREVLA